MSLRRPGPLPEIDGLRAIAVLLVILTHVLQATPGLIGPASPLNNGWIGVDLFFVLSGYLVGGQILRQLDAGRFGFRDFYRRRFFRILPAYFALLASFTALAFAWPAAYRALAVDPFSWHGLAKNAALLTDYFSHDMGIRSWSLSVEEQFYWLAPVLLLAVRGRAGPILAALYVLTVAGRAFSYWKFGLGPDVDVLEVFRRIYLPFHSRLDGLLAGMLVALAPRAGSGLRRLGLAIVALVAAVGGVRGGFFATVVQFTMLSAGFGLILSGVLEGRGRLARSLRWRGWTPVARLSYALYLTQFVAIKAVEALAPPAWAYPPLMLAGCVACAWPLYAFVEEPAHEWVKRTGGRAPAGTA